MYVKVVNGVPVKYPYTERDLRVDNPRVSFPENMDIATRKEFGMHVVVQTAKPNHNPVTQKLVERTPVWNEEKGQWEQLHQVVDLSNEEKNALYESNASSVRSTRNLMLSACDWTQLPDSGADTKAWAEYRQALRNISNQAGFPFDVKWPTEPAL